MENVAAFIDPDFTNFSDKTKNCCILFTLKATRRHLLWLLSRLHSLISTSQIFHVLSLSSLAAVNVESVINL